MNSLLLHPVNGLLVAGALLAAVRGHHVLETFAALPLEVLADDGTLRQHVAVPAAGPDCRCRQAKVGRAFLGAGSLMSDEHIQPEDYMLFLTFMMLHKLI